jgi:hypothetical protein
MLSLPKKIKFNSDDTELEFVEFETIDRKKNKQVGRYEYVKANVHIGKTIALRLDYLVYLQECRLLEILEP